MALRSNEKEETRMGEQIVWDLVNPEGTTQAQPFIVKPHTQSLENKTILFHWNAKHNGDIFLNKIADLLTEKVKCVKIIKAWEVAPETAVVSGNSKTSKEKARKLSAYKPDLSIASQCD
jgi:hypothetical protein